MSAMNPFEYYFAELIRCAGVAYLTITILLALIKAPSTDEFKPYRKAKRLLTCSFATMSLNLFLWCMLTNGKWHEFNYSIAAVDISLFYLLYMLLCNSYCILLNKNYVTSRRFVIAISVWLLTSLIAFSALLEPLREWRNTLTLTALCLLIAYIVKFVYSFFREYRRYRQNLENYFTDDMHRFAQWIMVSVVMCIISWCLAIATMFGSVYFNWIYQFYVISLNVYIAVSFVNYSSKYGILVKAEPEYASGEEIADEKNSGAERETIEKKIQAWTEKKRYLSDQFTLEDLAQVLGTNKNYLSYHINEKYGMSFSSWISEMRIDEAKRMMKENPDRKLENIAFSVGFSSASYFSKVFSLHEGVSPMRWRKEELG